MSELPNGWVRAPLDAIADVLDHEREPINSSERESRISGKLSTDLYPYYGATGQVGLIDSFRSDGQRVLLGEDAAPFLDQFKDKAYIANGRFWVNNHAHVLAGAAGLVDNRFLCFQLNTVDYHPFVTGSTRLKLTSSAMKQIPMAVAPAAEQTRIVEKLEELLSDLDAGVAELKAAQKKLSQYRQSLLKAAVEGALTAEWRAARLAPLSPCGRGAGGEGATAVACEPPLPNPSPTRGEGQNRAQTHTETPLPPRGGGAGGEGASAETGEQLLQRILQERRARWEAKQLAKFKEQGKTPPKDWQKKYPEPVQPDTSGLPELPQGWVWASVDQLSEIQGGIQKQPSRTPLENRFPFLRVANVARGRLKLDEVHEIELFAGELDRLALMPGDVLIVEGNGSLTEIGRCAVWDGSIKNAVCQNHLIRVRPLGIESQFLEAWINSVGGIEKLTKLAATTSGLYTLSVGKIAKIPVPVAPLLEQKEAIELLAEQLAGLEAKEQSVMLALKQSTAQRQNILRAAFAGQLVPQDPADEPASRLLERIRAERAAREPAKKPRGRPAKTMEPAR